MGNVFPCIKDVEMIKEKKNLLFLFSPKKYMDSTILTQGKS